MGKKTKTPATPDYAGAAKETAANSERIAQGVTRANRPNQVGPGGSVTWEQDPNGNWTQTTSLDNQNQAIYDTLQGKRQSALSGFDTGQVDFGNAPAMPTIGQYNQQATDTIRALQAPQLARRRQAQEAKMAAMGLGSGSGQASSNMQADIGTAENQADLQAVLEGINQGNVQFGQGMQQHQQGVEDILGQKAANLSQLGGLFGLNNPSVDVSSFMGATGGQAADMSGALGNTYNAALNAANARNADKSSTMGTIGTIGGAVLMAF